MSLDSIAIPLTQGKYAIVDSSDFDRVARFKWYAKRDKQTWYAMRGVYNAGRTDIVSMHRFLMDAPDGVEIDHIDGDGLNNRRANLRLATRMENSENKRRHRNNRSGFKGVCVIGNLWVAKVATDYLGTFDSAEEAARAYDTAARRKFGAFAKTNFSDGQDVEPRVRSLRRANTSGFAGVTFRKAEGKWTARFAFKGRRLFLGYFATKEAARAWDAKAVELLGSDARLNFPAD